MEGAQSLGRVWPVISGTSEESGVVWVCSVHTSQNGFLVVSGRAAVQQSGEAGVRVLASQLFLLLAEVESFFWLEDLRGVGLLGLRGGHTCTDRKTDEHMRTSVLKVRQEVLKKPVARVPYICLNITETSATFPPLYHTVDLLFLVLHTKT